MKITSAIKVALERDTSNIKDSVRNWQGIYTFIETKKKKLTKLKQPVQRARKFSAVFGATSLNS